MTTRLDVAVPWSDAPHATPLADVRRAQRECRPAARLDYHSVALARPAAWRWFVNNTNCADLYGRRTISMNRRETPLEALGAVLLGENLPSPHESDPNDPGGPPPGEVWLYSRPGDPEPACVLKVG